MSQAPDAAWRWVDRAASASSQSSHPDQIPIVYAPEIGAAVFLLFALYMARHAWVSFGKARRSLGWPQAKAVISKLTLWGPRRIDGAMVECQHLAIAYRYSVDGIEYTGADAAFYTLHYPETLEFAERHPLGSDTIAYYNPLDPGQSVLKPGPHPTKPHGGLILAALALLVSLAVLLLVVQDLP